MIADTMEHIGLYEGILPHAKALAQLWREGRLGQEAHPFEVRDKHYNTRPDAERRYEVHAHTVDLMIGLSGEEIIDICPQAALMPAEPLAGGADGMKMDGSARGSALLLAPGCFVAIYPAEAHRVGGMIGGEPEAVHKLVVKLNMK